MYVDLLKLNPQAFVARPCSLVRLCPLEGHHSRWSCCSMPEVWARGFSVESPHLQQPGGADCWEKGLWCVTARFASAPSTAAYQPGCSQPVRSVKFTAEIILILEKLLLIWTIIQNTWWKSPSRSFPSHCLQVSAGLLQVFWNLRWLLLLLFQHICLRLPLKRRSSNLAKWTQHIQRGD